MSHAPKCIRVEPPFTVTLDVVSGPGGPEVYGTDALGIHPEGLLVRAAPARLAEIPRTPEGELEIIFTLDGTTVRARARPEDAGDQRSFLRFAALDGRARAVVDTFITRNRKSEHIRIVRDHDTASEGITTGLERWRLPHEALPELDKGEVDLRTTVLGRALRAPILISCMTGGSELAKTVNRRLARAAQELGLALGLGSQRAMLVSPGLADTFAVRDIAPDVLLIGNLGAVQLNYGVDVAACERIVREVGADALALHLNPLQEAVQPEGDVDFRGLKDKVAAAAAGLPFPVLLKEVGSGISRGLARWAAGTRLAGVDVAGAGGTNWAKVESYRAESPLQQRLARSFAGWGIPTADSVVACRAALPDRVVIASGGIRDGIEAAKAIALGADLVGLARPFLDAAARSEEEVIEAGRLLVEQLRVAMFCAGARDVAALRRVELEKV